MIYNPNVRKAMVLMYDKHKGQVDKAGYPYVFHPLHVAEQMKDENTTIAALLHDVVEDTDTTFEDLRNYGISEDVIEALKLLTHNDNEDYYEYVRKIAYNPIARKVKIKDLEHNMDLTRLNKIEPHDLERLAKYRSCHDFLMSIDKEYDNRNARKAEMSKINFNEGYKIKDGMFGLAIADAVGVPAEFKSRDILKKRPITDMVGYGTHSQPPGTWSDDSSMAIATMDSINEWGTIDYDDIMKKFAEWVDESKYTATGDFFDIGITTSNAISRYKRGVAPTDCGDKGVNSNGNGSLMRILPVVLYSYYNDLSNVEEIELINSVSSLTHAHSISCLGCKIFSDLIKKILDGKNVDEAYHSLNYDDYAGYYDKPALDYYKRVFDGSLATESESRIRSSGFVVDTLEASIWANLTSNNYEEAVLKAVNLGNDTDTVGAVTGAIAGIAYGYDNIPKKWRKNLNSKEFLESVCNSFEKQLDNKKGNKSIYK